MTTEEIEREIETTMRDRGIDRGEATFLVGLKYGELHGDLLFMRPLSSAQRRQLSQPLHETMAELGELDGDLQEPAAATSTAPVGQSRRRAS